MPPPRVKICGITCLEDAYAAVEAGADALGFVFAESPRRISPAAAASIISRLPPFVTTVGLVVDEDPSDLLDECPLDMIQFHGDEPPELVARIGRRSIKAFRIRTRRDLEQMRLYPSASAHLLDAYHPQLRGGTGVALDWQDLSAAIEPGPALIIAGGLTHDNVAECVRLLRPYAVDVSSGVERAPGRKDPDLVRRFIAAAKSAGGYS